MALFIPLKLIYLAVLFASFVKADDDDGPGPCAADLTYAGCLDQ